MDRIHAASETFPGVARSSDFHSDYVPPSGYRSSLSLYDAFDEKPINRDSYGLSGGFSVSLSRDGLGPISKDGPGIEEGYTEPLSYGGYSYSSSYEDMRKSAHEGKYSSSGSGASAYDKYDYGSDKASSVHESYRGNSLAPYYNSLTSFDGSLASSTPLTPSLYGGDGQNFGTRHEDLSYQQTADTYQMQYGYLGLNKSNATSLNKSDVLAFEQSPALRQGSAMLRSYDLTYPPSDTVGLADAAADYEQASRLSRKYDSSFSGMFSTFGALDDWRNAGGRLHDAGSLLSNVQEPYALGRSANGSRVAGGSVYSDLNNLGLWDRGVARQGLPSLSENQVVGGSMQMLGINAGREATEKKRRSRWEPVEDEEKNGQNGSENKKRKSRWSEEKPPVKELNLSDIFKGEDSDQIALRAQLIIINRRLQSGQVADDRPEAERSPSPEPVFDNFGYQVNTREYRARERLTKERQRIIAQLSEKSSTFKPPPDFKQSKCSRKIFIPVDKHPDYNFVGLIIGPRGHTQKKMEKESGAKIFIRGKGSVREGSSTLTGLIETEDLHVLIEADVEESVNKAADMVEKLLVPVRDEQNEHKKAQLRELATLNGTLRSNELCKVGKEAGHVAKDCPMASPTASSSAAAAQKGDASQDNQHCHVCKGRGHLGKECPSTRPISGSLSKGGLVGSGGAQVTDLNSWFNNDNDNTLVYVAFLPLSVNDTQLRSLFSSFGQIVNARVMRHLTTGISKSYAFVKFSDAADASQAVALMNGYKLDGKVLSVKLRINAGL